MTSLCDSDYDPDKKAPFRGDSKPPLSGIFNGLAVDPDILYISKLRDRSQNPRNPSIGGVTVVLLTQID